MSVQECILTGLGAALEGERVAFFEASQAEARALFHAVDALAPEGCSVVRTNGGEAVRTRQGGSVRFFSVRSGGSRGVTLDRAYVPAALASEDSVALSIHASLAASKRPQFIGYL